MYTYVQVDGVMIHHNTFVPFIILAHYSWVTLTIVQTGLSSISPNIEEEKSLVFSYMYC